MKGYAERRTREPRSFEDAIFELLETRPALRRVVARTEEESVSALRAYRLQYYGVEDDGSCVRTKDVRDELLSLCEALNER